MYSRSYQHYVTGLLLVVYIFNQLDRAIFGFLMEPIKQEFGLSDTQLGFLLGPALVIFYAGLGIPIARWADRSHRVHIMCGAIVLWSTIVMLSAAVSRFWQLALARVGVGIGEAGFSAIAMSVIGDYHKTEEERTRALSNFLLAIPIAGVLSGLFAGWINEAYGWRAVFLAAGLPGILIAALMKFTVREPLRRPGPSLQIAGEPPSIAAVFAALWRQRTLRHLLIAQGLANIVVQAMGWAPTYFIRAHGMSTGELGTWMAAIAGIGGVASIWLSGQLTSRYGAHDQRLRVWLMAAAAALVVPLAAFVVWSPSKELALVGLLIAQLPMLFFVGPTSALVQDLSEASMRATMASIFILVQVLSGGVIGVQLVGVLSDLLRGLTLDDTAALRLSMTGVSLVGIWAGAHFWLAGRWVRQDLRAAAPAADLTQTPAGRLA
jgi:MFS family permease